jgi:hypothetical protein
MHEPKRPATNSNKPSYGLAALAADWPSPTWPLPVVARGQNGRTGAVVRGEDGATKAARARAQSGEAPSDRMAGSAKGERRGGRQRGTPNKRTEALKHAQAEAAAKV